MSAPLKSKLNGKYMSRILYDDLHLSFYLTPQVVSLSQGKSGYGWSLVRGYECLDGWSRAASHPLVNTSDALLQLGLQAVLGGCQDELFRVKDLSLPLYHIKRN